MPTFFFDSLLTLAYPQACGVCQNSVENSRDGVVCRDCWKQTELFSGKEIVCHKCGKFLSGAENDFQTFCHQCDAHFYDRARAVGLYEKGLQASILHLKRQPFVCGRLREIFINAFINSDFSDADKLIPVPLSKKRLVERGFNQALVPARILSKSTKIELDEHSLVRKIHTPMHRAGMDKKAREQTVKNAFEVKRPKLIESGKILLIDDVFTSGATASACAEVLKKAGAEKVYVLTLARAS
jgi:competence protein ComFC